MTDILTAALYLRSAVESDFTIGNQRERCTSHAISAGYSIAGVFADNGASGMRDRPGLAALRTFIEAGRTKVVVTIDPTRISPDYKLLIEHERFFDRYGIKLLYVDLPEDWTRIEDTRVEATQFHRSPSRARSLASQGDTIDTPSASFHPAPLLLNEESPE